MPPFQGGIRFNDCVFTEPARLSDWTPPGCAGIVAVLAHDPAWSPRPFRPLYFGEFGNDTRGLAGSAPYLVAVLSMPYSTTRQRQALCDELIHAYNPILQGSESMLHLFTPRPEVSRRPIGFMPETELLSHPRP
jgi:hypothetical protein